MSNTKGNLLLRNDTFLGVCEGLGQDFGIHPNWLRIALALAFFLSPVGVVAAYLAIGTIVAISRFVYPDRIVEAAAAATDSAQQPAGDEETLPLAA